MIEKITGKERVTLQKKNNDLIIIHRHILIIVTLNSLEEFIIYLVLIFFST